MSRPRNARSPPPTEAVLFRSRMRAAGAPSRCNDERSQRAGASVRNRPPRDQRQAHFRLGLGRASGACDRGRRARARRRRLAEAAAGPISALRAPTWSAHFRCFATRGRRASSSPAIRRGSRRASSSLELRFDDGEALGLDITHVGRIAHAPATGNSASSSGSRARPGAGCGAATFAGSCAGRVAQNYGAPSLDDLDAVRRLLPQLRAARPSCLVFDHNLGGGANQYRRQMIGERLAGGGTVLLCTYNLPTLDYRLQVFRPGGGEEIYRISSFLGLEPILAQGAGRGDLPQQPRLVRRAARVRGLDRRDARRASRRPG